jgi:hypothetical protein|tara:strand:+ start:1489 stop:1764 length:276 start_codon:yes stop_codon:yes gene_type:complete
MASEFTPTPVPALDNPELERFLAELQEQLAGAISAAQATIASWDRDPDWVNAPSGQIAVFDGSDPGSGEGIYYRRGGSWYKLTEAAGTFYP